MDIDIPSPPCCQEGSLQLASWMGICCIHQFCPTNATLGHFPLSVARFPFSSGPGRGTKLILVLHLRHAILDHISALPSPEIESENFNSSRDQRPNTTPSAKAPGSPSTV